MNKKNDFDHVLGIRIKEAREQARVTQDQLAAAVGLSRTSITNIERGRQGVQVSTLVNISRTLGKSVADLIPDYDMAEAESLPEKLRKAARDDRKFEWAARIIGFESEDSRDGS